jgi:hypothetical protein
MKFARLLRHSTKSFQRESTVQGRKLSISGIRPDVCLSLCPSIAGPVDAFLARAYHVPLSQSPNVTIAVWDFLPSCWLGLSWMFQLLIKTVPPGPINNEDKRLVVRDGERYSLVIGDGECRSFDIAEVLHLYLHPKHQGSDKTVGLSCFL